jgi:hypothetical protein
VQDYLDAMNDYLDCLADEHQSASNEASKMVETWEDAAQSYNHR